MVFLGKVRVFYGARLVKRSFEEKRGRSDPIPHWPRDELKRRLEKKRPNTVYVHAVSRKSGSGYEEFRYDQAAVYEGIDWDKIFGGLSSGQVRVDFDARTRHNHGTKFRIRQGNLNQFYANRVKMFGPT